MRNRINSLVTLPVFFLAVLALSYGCEPQAGGGDPDLERAIELIDLASQGYVSAEYADEFDVLDAEGFRQATLREALSHLEAAAGRGEPTQRVTARKMMADILASAARDQARQANAAYSELVVTNGLTAQLRLVSKAHLRTRLLEGDRSVVRAELEQERESQLRQRDGLREMATGLEEELANLIEQRDEHAQRASDLRAEYHALQEEAFTLEGDEYYELMDRADEAERRAAEADVEAEDLDVRIERRRSELTGIEAELAGIQEVLEDVAEQLDAWENREQVRSEQFDRVAPEHVAAAEELVSRFDSAMQRYEEHVHEPFAAGAEHIAEAIERLEAAVDQSRGSERDELQSELLSKRLTQVNLLSDQVVAAGGFGRTLDTLASRAPQVIPEQFDADAFSRSRQRLAERQQQVAEAAESAVQIARTLASELGNVADERIQRFADRQRPRLGEYLEMIEQHKLY